MKNSNNKFQIKLGNKSISLIMIIIILFLITSGSTFAYFAFGGSNSVIGGDAGSVNLTLTVNKVLPNTNGVDDILVINHSEVASSLNNGCIDNDGDFTLCQLYRVNLANSADSVNANLKGSISFTNEKSPNLSWILLGNSYSSSTTYTSTMLGSTFNTASSTFTNFVDSYLLTAGSNIDYYILVWVNETEDVQTDEGSYFGVVRFEESNGKGVTATFSG